ncbi:uncharacterized protein [Dermacentor albipictus]|uniref:uncharacterized protein isoform X1 n=1 Tax=Dermacentor albipictus TaxID=60249 RepID=UPI0031FC18E4
MAGKETAGPHFTMSSGSCNVDQGTSSAATDLIHGSGVSTIPVALVPTNGGSIRITNPQAVQKALKATSNHFQTITDVRAFGRGGIVCRSPDQTCVEDLLKCTSFASTPVPAFDGADVLKDLRITTASFPKFPKKPEKQRGTSERTRRPTECKSAVFAGSVSPTRRPSKSTSLTTCFGK